MHGNRDNGQFIDPEEVNDISEEQKEYLLKTGYRPFLTAHGRVKWITPEQHAYRSVSRSGSHMHRNVLERMFSSKFAQFVVIVVALLVIAVVLYVASIYL